MPKKLRVVAIGSAAAVAITLIVGGIYFSVASSQLERRTAALRAAGHPVTLADLARQPVAPEANAATYMRLARADAVQIQEAVSAVLSAQPPAVQDRFEQGYLSPELQNALESAFAKHADLIGLIEQAAACPNYLPQFDLTTDTQVFLDALMAQCDTARAVVRVLGYRALLQIADGQQEDALQTCLLMFRLCRHLDHNPTLTGYLVAVGCRSLAVARANLVLRAGPLPESLRDALNTELTHHESDDPLRYALTSERAIGLEKIQEMKRAVSFGPVSPPMFTKEADAYIDLIDAVVAQVGLCYADADKSRQLYSAAAKAPLIGTVVGSLQATQAASARVRTALRALRILNALQRHPEMTNAAEVKLSDLGLPAEATVDPYDGGQLHLKKRPEGWLIYAVGNNLKDDGGDLTGAPTSLDVGLGPPSTSAGPSGVTEEVPDSGE